MSDQEIIALLKAERPRHPELAETLDLHLALLEARAAINVNIPVPPSLDADARLSRGEPLLRADEFVLDRDLFAQLYKTLCDITARFRPAEADALVELCTLATDPAHLEQFARDYLANTGHASSHSSSVSPLLTFLLNQTLHPFLSAWRHKTKDLVNVSQWYRAWCPFCGGTPDFAALEKESGARRLLCSRCDGEWLFQRTTCPFCGTDAAGTWGYFPGNGAYRLYTCENCKRYLKTLDRRDLVRETLLPAERILTIGMDVAARQAGYQ